MTTIAGSVSVTRRSVCVGNATAATCVVQLTNGAVAILQIAHGVWPVS